MPNQNKEASLTYKPPKQPGANSSRSASPTPNMKSKHQSSIIFFKEVHAFQL